jgi:hypothetical protein
LEDVLQIVDFERVVQLRTQVPPIPQMCPFNNTNTPLNENLPTSLNPAENNVLDLSLLSGDLDDPDAKSEIVQDILERLSTMSIHYVVGVSGCGKTKALLDISHERFVLFSSYLIHFMLLMLKNLLMRANDPFKGRVLRNMEFIHQFVKQQLQR